MSEGKDLDQQKREAAERAKELARKKLEERNAAVAAQDSNKADASTGPSEDDKELAKKKAAAAAKAKAAALAKQKASEGARESAGDADDDVAKAKAKAAAAAKAKAAALAKQKASEGAGESAGDADDDLAKAKAKAVAAAKAKAAALAKQKAAEAAGATDGGSDDDLAKAKAKAVAVAKAKAAAAAKAKAAAGGDGSADDLAKEKAKAIAVAKAKAAAAAKAKAAGAGNDQADTHDEEKKPSPNQPYLDKYVKVISEHIGADVLEDSYINPLSKDVPTLIAKADTYFKVAQFLKFNEQLSFDYVSELHGSDFETHMEIYVHLFSFKNRQSVALKVKIDRDQPVIESLQPLWEGANWPEREAFDLLGIKFTGHPDLTRIMLPEDWVGYPLRKDYEPYDVEV
ncbi:NADH-quinone oxidoreductase subunit C [Cytobacillus sp. S13-E01]|uniref:NADH-quinone oxidoreductase subunit C n=1 Tax=Cytobacillus sp. S13-E01 TaxID=3031326 RepID=UPI0023D82EF8|nr:NADH-quinone oxidoreductase subunit C [Cytobacillus sp. S13-E01]MDF0726600.1 NADH-quinone oxidoreductase subunit C [Cytobacillus sp. S13-E01]